MTCKGINISAELENNIRTLSIFDVLFQQTEKFVSLKTFPSF